MACYILLTSTTVNLVSVITVQYRQRYFSKNKIRITIDRDIVYHKFTWQEYSPLSAYFEADIKLEAKTDVTTNMLEHPLLRTFQRTRFSKYCRGVDCIINNNRQLKEFV